MEVSTGPERRRHWTSDQKLAMVRESFEPGKSVSMVARQHGVNPHQFNLPPTTTKCSEPGNSFRRLLHATASGSSLMSIHEQVHAFP